MILPGSYANGFAPRDAQPLYPELWRGCIGAWAPCLGPTGVTLRDCSQYAFHGTLTNMDAGSDFVPDNGRYALEFDGTNDHVVTAASSPVSNAPVFQASWWMWFPTAGAWGTGLRNAFMANNANIAFRGAVFTFTNTTVNMNWQQTGLSSATGRDITANVKVGWNHFAGGAANGVYTWYVNGALVASQSYSGTLTLPTARPLEIGGDVTNARYFGGANSRPNKLNDLRFYNRQLSPNEVQLLASRLGISYEMAFRRRASFVAGFNRRRRLLVGAGS
jgi:hypothetical protein